MTYHSKYNEIKTLVEHNMNVLLSGERGSGKSTILQQVAKDLDMEYVSVTMTRQTTVGALLGFISVTGTYIPSLLRKAVENGHMFILEEIDGADPNTLLCLNTLENGYLSFPDGLVDVHENFRLCATANPAGEHQIYTGRAKLDAATLDRFDEVTVERDHNLEQQITSKETVKYVSIMRKLLANNNSSKTISMRDTIRFHKRIQLGMAQDYPYLLLDKQDHLLDRYKEKAEKAKPKEIKKQSECNTIDELWDAIISEGRSQTPEETETAPAYADKSKAQDLAKQWKQYKGNMPLPNNVKITEMSGLPENPYDEYIVVKLDEEVYKFNKRNL